MVEAACRRLEVFTNSSLQVYVGNIAVNKSAFVQPSLSECAVDAGGSQDRFLCGQDIYTGILPPLCALSQGPFSLTQGPFSWLLFSVY